MTLPKGYVPPSDWFRHQDGTKTCWYCAASVHEEVADLHAAWHERLEGDDPIARWKAPS